MSRRAVGLVVTALSLAASAAPADAQLLSRLTGPRAAAQLRSVDPDERAEASETLARWGEPGRAVEVLSEALRTERDVNVRRAIVSALARRGDASAVPALLEALESAANLDPATVILGLGAFDDDRAVRALVAALGQEDVREAAVRALVRSGPRAVPHLIRSLGEPTLAPSAMRVLGTVGDWRATAALVSRLSADDEPTRIAAVRALGELGDPRAAPALARCLSDPSPHVVAAALDALASAGEAGQAEAVAARVGDGEPAVRRAALSALLSIDPPAAIAVMERAVASGDPVLGRPSVDLALGCAHPRVVPLLYGLWHEGSRAAEAAGALAEVDGGLGIPVLAEAARERGAAGDAAARALAVGLRKWGELAGDDARERGFRALASRAAGDPRSLLLRSIARDPDVIEPLVRALRSEEPASRALAARGLELGGDEDAADAVARALVEERDPEAYRRMALAAASLGAKVPYRDVRPHLDSIDVGPEAMALAAASARAYSRRERDRVARLLRTGLRAEDARVRAGAARALAVSGDREAWRALVFALDDAAPEVRLAAATALADLGVAEAAPGVLARWRVEEDPRVAPALLAAAGSGRSRVPPERGAAGGSEAVRVRIVAVSGESQRGVPVEVVLPDGRWLRIRTLPSGELILVDLPASVADVRVRVSE